jgi:Na+-driven multidrug efflux pump
MINTKWVMISSALVMGITGILLSFIPQEIITFFDSQAISKLDTIMLQVAGALYFGFAMLNWTAKSNLIGGIYGRPIAIANLSHFLVASLALIKAYSSGQSLILIPTIIYSLFAIAFSIIFVTHPLKQE